MPAFIVGITQTKALMLDLALLPASKRYKGGIATYPLLTTQRFDQRRCGITAKPTMLAGKVYVMHSPCVLVEDSVRPVLGALVQHLVDHCMLRAHLQSNLPSP